MQDVRKCAYIDILAIFIQKCLILEEKVDFFKIRLRKIHGFIRIYPKWIYPSSQPCPHTLFLVNLNARPFNYFISGNI